MDHNVANGPSKRTRGARQKGVDTVTKKFLHNFDPEQSEREKRKLNRRLHHGNKKTALYDEKGIFIATGEDLCDCLEKSCPGCHFPCPKCSSTKCAYDCRNNRKWVYEAIENEGRQQVRRESFTPRGDADGGSGRGDQLGLRLPGDLGQDEPQRECPLPGPSHPREEPLSLSPARAEQ